MALSTTSFSNFFSFLSPPSKSPPPPPQLPFLHHNNHRNKFIPLVLSRSETTSSTSVTSSSSQQQQQQLQQQDDLDSSFDSLSSVNSIFLASPYNVQVMVEDDEPEERLVGRFRREVLRAGIIQESKRRRYFENKQEEKKRRVQDAAKRNRRARFPRYVMEISCFFFDFLPINYSTQRSNFVFIVIFVEEIEQLSL
jgi:ribosomal protein S21